MTLRLTTPLPSTNMIFAVNGHRQLHEYDASRHAVLPAMIERLEEAGIDYRSFRKVLDFGCGCGRILSSWEHYMENVEALHGIDVNRRLVRYCQQNIPHAIVDPSTYYPPSPFKDDYFDFMYAGSVWTHLDREAAEGWATEARRVVRPGGILMMSFHGEYYLPELRRIAPQGEATLQAEGFYMHEHGKPGARPAGDSAYATFMTSDFVMSLFGGFTLRKMFPGLTRGPHPFASYQDIAVLEKI